MLYRWKIEMGKSCKLCKDITRSQDWMQISSPWCSSCFISLAMTWHVLCWFYFLISHLWAFSFPHVRRLLEGCGPWSKLSRMDAELPWGKEWLVTVQFLKQFLPPVLSPHHFYFLHRSIDCLSGSNFWLPVLWNLYDYCPCRFLWGVF